MDRQTTEGTLKRCGSKARTWMFMMLVAVALLATAPPAGAQTISPTCPTNPNKDHWGCDVVDAMVSANLGVPSNGLNGSPKGGCCDFHDAAYALSPEQCDGDPTHWQWLTAFALCNPFSLACLPKTVWPCVNADINVINCFKYQSPGPSVCIAQGVCGDARNVNNPWGCIADAQCAKTGPGTICDCATGLCTTPPPQGGGEGGGGEGGGGGGGPADGGCLGGTYFMGLSGDFGYGLVTYGCNGEIVSIDPCNGTKGGGQWQCSDGMHYVAQAL